MVDDEIPEGLNEIPLEKSLVVQEQTFERTQALMEDIVQEVRELNRSSVSKEDFRDYLSDVIDRQETESQNTSNALMKLKQREVIFPEQISIMEDQQEILEKAYELDSKQAKKQNEIFENMNSELSKLEEDWRKADEKEEKERKRKFVSSLKNPFEMVKNPFISTLLGPLRLITDPLTAAAKELGISDYIQEKQKKKYEREDAINDVYDKYQKLSEEAGAEALADDSVDSILDKPISDNDAIVLQPDDVRDEAFDSEPPLLALPPAQGEAPLLALPPAQSETPLLALPPAQNEGIISGDEGIIDSSNEWYPSDEHLQKLLFEKTSPEKSALLRKGGIIGAGFVFLAKALRGEDENESLRKKSLKDDNENGVSKKVLEFLKANGKSLAQIAVPILVAAGGAVAISKGMEMQKRDTEDSKKYFDSGDATRGVETAILGDRSRLTEENANSELGRTTGKTALLAGGAAALAAGGAGVVAGTAAGIGAGGAALAGGAAMGGALTAGLGAAGAAGMATLGAVAAPAAIAAAIIVAGVAIAKGTQEAYELEWDKNQASIQKDLTRTMLDDDASFGEKLKANLQKGWKGLTGTLAGGVRGATDVLDVAAMERNERQIDYIKKQAEAGNEGFARLQEIMQDEQFKAMSEEEQKTTLEAKGLYDEYKEAQKESRASFTDNIKTIAGAEFNGFAGLIDTRMEGMRGDVTAVWEKKQLKGMKDMSGDDVKRLEGSDVYKNAIAEGKNAKQAMQDAYLDEKKQMAIARGDLNANGDAKRMKDYGAAFFSKKTDDEYRKTFEYSKTKAHLMDQGMSSEEADLEAIKQQNEMYEAAMTLRLKQTSDYKKEFDKQIKEGKSMKDAEKAALKKAKENKKNTMTLNQLASEKIHEIGSTVKEWANTVGDFLKGIWDAVSNWFSSIGKNIGNFFSEAGANLKNKALDVGAKVKDGVFNLFGLDDKDSSEDADKKDISDKSLPSTAEQNATTFDSTNKSVGDNVFDKPVDDNVSVADSAATENSFPDISNPDAKANDAFVLKDGKVIQLSDDDNVYATKNTPRVARDIEAQRAMPSVSHPPAEFTDEKIIAKIEELIAVIAKKNMTVNVAAPFQETNFSKYRVLERAS